MNFTVISISDVLCFEHGILKKVSQGNCDVRVKYEVVTLKESFFVLEKSSFFNPSKRMTLKKVQVMSRYYDRNIELMVYAYIYKVCTFQCLIEFIQFIERLLLSPFLFQLTNFVMLFEVCPVQGLHH